MDSRVPSMQETCGTPSKPSARNSSTVASVPSRVDPPAPKVTEQNAGLSAANSLRAARSLSTASGVRGGKNSRLQTGFAAEAIGGTGRQSLFASRSDDSAHEIRL